MKSEKSAIREVLAARLGLQVATDKRRQRNAIQAYQETSHTNVENFQDYQNYPETSQKYQEIPRSNGKSYAGALLPRDRVFAILSPVARSVAAQEVRNSY